MKSSKHQPVKVSHRRTSSKRGTELNDFDLAISAYSEKIKQRLEEEPSLHIYDIPFVPDPYLLCLLQYIYSKSLKTAEHFLFIQHYLTTFQTLIMTLFKKKQMTDPKVLLSKLAYFLNFEKLAQGTIICRYGDPGDKFYLIFSGRIAVIITKDYKVKMNQFDFEKHLGHLFDLKEYELALKTINSNLDVYSSQRVYDLRWRITDLQQRAQVSNDSSSKGVESKYDTCAIEEYINRIVPKESVIPLVKRQNSFEVVKEIEELNEVTAWVYFQVAQLEESQTFGDVALSDAISKRTASIICLEDSTFGSLEMQIYKKCIKSSQEVIRRMNIECILTNPLFEGISMDFFNKKYFNYFRLIELSLGDCLFHQGHERFELFFLKEGEIQLMTSSSLNDINNIMEHLGHANKSKVQEEKMQLKSQAIKKHFALIKPNLKLVIYNQRNAIGLDDCMYNDRYFVTAKCQSQKVLAYAVEYNFFAQMITCEKRLERNVSSYLPLRKSIMTDRLKQIKNISLISKMNAMNEEGNQSEEIESMNTAKTQATITLYKTALKPNNLREKLSGRLKNITSSLNCIHPKIKLHPIKIREMLNKATFASPKNKSSASVSIRGGNSLLFKSHLKKKEKSTANSPTYESSAMSNHQESIDLSTTNRLKNNRLLNHLNNIHDSGLGKYLETCCTGTDRLRKEGNHSRNILIKLKKHLTEGIPLINLNPLKAKASNCCTQENQLVLSQIDCLAFDSAMEKSQVIKEQVVPAYRRKRIQLPLIKRKYLKQSL